jgi:hypothetical protein
MSGFAIGAAAMGTAAPRHARNSIRLAILYRRRLIQRPTAPNAKRMLFPAEMQENEKW